MGSLVKKWLLRKRDQNSVSYSRFGLPGEEQQEPRAPPTIILMAPFEENSEEFLCTRFCHSQTAAVVAAGFGMSIVLLVFSASFLEFDWLSHDKGVDVLAFLGLLLFLIVGMLVHYLVIYGIRKQEAHFLLPFIFVYMMFIAIEVMMYITASYHWMHQQTESSAQNLLWIGLIFFAVLIAVQAAMLVAVARCRNFLSKRHLHLAATRVAERSREQNPTLRVVFVQDNQP